MTTRMSRVTLPASSTVSQSAAALPVIVPCTRPSSCTDFSSWMMRLPADVAPRKNRPWGSVTMVSVPKGTSSMAAESGTRSRRLRHDLDDPVHAVLVVTGQGARVLDGAGGGEGEGGRRPPVGGHRHLTRDGWVVRLVPARVSCLHVGTAHD